MRTLILLLALWMVPSAVYSGEPDKKLHQKCIYPTVMVANEDAGGNGSGVIIRSEKLRNDLYYNLVLTCAHNFANPGQYTIRVAQYKDWSVFDKYDNYRCTLTAINNDHDLALVAFLSDKPVPVADLGLDNKIYLGHRAWRVGCGLGNVPRLDYGEVTGMSEEDKTFVSALRFNIFTSPGDSGGPVYHEDKVIALAKSIRVRQHFTGFPPTFYFSMMYATPVTNLKVWDVEKHGKLSYAYKNTKMPQMPIYILATKEFRVEIKPEVRR